MPETFTQPANEDMATQMADAEALTSHWNVPRNPIEIAQSYLSKAEEDWTYVDPEDVLTLSRAVVDAKVTMYDADLDLVRDVTQEDVDRLVNIALAQSKFRAGIRALDAACKSVIIGDMSHEDMGKIEEAIIANHGMANSEPIPMNRKTKSTA
jgi:hypothetical protein